MDKRNIKFDALVSHDITYVGIIQTARASGLEEFPVPYAHTSANEPITVDEVKRVQMMTEEELYEELKIIPYKKLLKGTDAGEYMKKRTTS